MSEFTPQIWFFVASCTLLGFDVGIFILLIREYSTLVRKVHDLELGPEKSLRHVHGEALETIQSLKSSATAVISQIELHKLDFEKEIGSELTRELGQSVRTVTESIRQSALTLQSTVAEQNSEILAHMRNEYTNALNKLTSEVLILERVLTEDFVKRKTQIESELGTYEQARRKEIEDSIDTLVFETMRKCVPDIIPVDMHKKIILRALEEALNEGKFKFDENHENNI